MGLGTGRKDRGEGVQGAVLRHRPSAPQNEKIFRKNLTFTFFAPRRKFEIHPGIPDPRTMGQDLVVRNSAEPPAQVAVDANTIKDLVPHYMQKAIDESLFTNGELFGKDEKTLYKLLRSQEETPTPTDHRLRLKFWFEYDQVRERGGQVMRMPHVIAGITTPQYFSEVFIKRPEKLAWLLCPPASYLVKTEEGLSFGIDQLRDILEQDHILPNGRVDTKLGELKAKITMMLDARVKGAVVQRSLNLNVTAGDAADIAKATTASTMEDLEKQLKELRRRDRLSRNLPPGSEDIEVT